jgi:hypothetical protein
MSNETRILDLRLTSMGKLFKGYFASLIEPTLVPTALKVALIVGSILFVINHGSAVLQGEMSRDRWISAGITYLVPYFVNIHGQYVSICRSLNK